jgi:guanyl-specific ribonuclease Sa
MIVRRLFASLAAVFALSAGALVAPAVVAPTHTAAAEAAVYPSCTIARCAAARTARTGWTELGWPATRGWYSWPYGRFNYTGGTFYNREGQLPAGATYGEYDVYPRDRGAARDAYRIVVNRATRETWFTPDHYLNFYKL